jgi:ketosteroid isomerase-like protein
MASAQQLRAAIKAHVAAVGAADAPMLAALYARDGRVIDPAGAAPVVGRADCRALGPATSSTP